MTPEGYAQKMTAAGARQLAGPHFAEGWIGLGLSPEGATGWANRGFLPAEADDWLACGFTPDQAAHHAGSWRTPAQAREIDPEHHCQVF